MLFGRRKIDRLMLMLADAGSVVWVEPGDILVISGMDLSDPGAADATTALTDAIAAAGVPCNGVLYLEANAEIAAISPRFLTQQHRAGLGGPGRADGSCVTERSVVSVRCPRCPTLLPITVTVDVDDTEAGLRAHADAEQLEVEQHALTCGITRTDRLA